MWQHVYCLGYVSLVLVMYSLSGLVLYWSIQNWYWYWYWYWYLWLQVDPHFQWGSTCNHNYQYQWLPCQYFILLMTGAWRPKHVEKVCSNKICILLHHVGVLFNLRMWHALCIKYFKLMVYFFFSRSFIWGGGGRGDGGGVILDLDKYIFSWHGVFLFSGKYSN